MYRHLPYYEPAPEARRARALAAAALRAAGAALDRLAARLAAHQAHRAAPVEHVVEFHAEAGAPEGALYVDGHLVGKLEGVTRL
jgi:hypothetical protein